MQKLNRKSKEVVDFISKTNSNIFGLIKHKGLSLSDVCKKIDVVNDTLQKWKKGLSGPGYLNLYKLSKLLNVGPERFFAGTTTPPETETGADDMRETISALKLANAALVGQVRVLEERLSELKAVHENPMEDEDDPLAPRGGPLN